jgi:hypothetical protein
MALRIEWRSRAEGDDTVLAIEDGSNAVVKAWIADIDILTDYLNDMIGLDVVEGDAKSGNGVDYSKRAPQEWGNCVISRSETGEVLSVDPQLYWEGIAYWFRSRGRDPHPARPISSPAPRSWSDAASKPSAP